MTVIEYYSEGQVVGATLTNEPVAEAAERLRHLLNTVDDAEYRVVEGIRGRLDIVAGFGTDEEFTHACVFEPEPEDLPIDFGDVPDLE